MGQHTWRETDFERWFLQHPYLPGNERVLVVGHQHPLRRVVDLLAIDAEGGLVIIEVKNEKSTRTVIGQSVEYLSQYERASMDDLAEEWEESFGGGTASMPQAFEDTFGKKCPLLSQRRRVLVVAPGFDPHSSVCASFLSEKLAPAGIEYSLVAAEQTADGFVLKPYECPPLENTKKLVGRFSITPRGRVYYILEAKPNPIAWNVGRLMDDGRLRIPVGPAITKRGLRIIKRILLPLESLPNCDLSLTGSAWAFRKRQRHVGKVIGRSAARPDSPDDDWHVIIARFDDHGFKFFQKKNWVKFQQEWQRTDASLPGWSEIAEMARSRLLTRGQHATKSANR